MKIGRMHSKSDERWRRLEQNALAKLSDRIRKHEIPEPMVAPAQDIVIVYRLPAREKETLYKGLLHIPETSQSEPMPYSLGVYLLGGLEAYDILSSHGILVGDYVKFGRFAGDEETHSRVQEAITGAIESGKDERAARTAAMGARDAEMSKKKILELHAADIHGSVDLLDRLYGDTPTMEVERRITDKGILHVINAI